MEEILNSCKNEEGNFMTTKSKREAVIEALHKIEDYCKKEIMPKMYDDKLEVNFGEYAYRLSSGVTYEYLFGIDVKNDSIYYRTGSVTRCFDGTVYENWNYAKVLIFHWLEIKHKLFEGLNKQKQEMETILNFQV